MKYEDSKRCSKYKDDNKSELKQTGEVKSIVLKTVSSEQTIILKNVYKSILFVFIVKIMPLFEKLFKYNLKKRLPSYTKRIL